MGVKKDAAWFVIMRFFSIVAGLADWHSSKIRKLVIKFAKFKSIIAILQRSIA